MKQITQKTKPFQIRWNEPLGKKDNPYAHRYVFIFFGYAIRIHIWKCSDGPVENSNEKHFHNHPWWFITWVIKGSYNDITVQGKELLKTGAIRYRKANHLHYVEPNKGGCITILLTGRPKQKWGFLVNNRILRPLKYFHKFGDNAPCKD